MDQKGEPASATIYDRILGRIQTRLAGRVSIPFEIRLWGDRTYRFGEGEPQGLRTRTSLLPRICQ
jgi:hypothetical protein